MELLDQLCREMIAYDKGDPRRIHHFLKVHAFAEQIGREEETAFRFGSGRLCP